jgi:spore maturation protein CgeB
MRLAYIGTDSETSTSLQRIRALERLGHDVLVVNPFRAYYNRGIWPIIHYRTGYLLALKAVERYVLHALAGKTYDAIFVNHGENVGPGLLRKIKKYTRYTINYNADDPFGPNEKIRWVSYLMGVNYYDLVVVKRLINLAEASRRGVGEVVREYLCFDPIAHASLPETEKDRACWSSDVVFVGTWMPGREVFMKTLVDRGVPLSIYGPGWTQKGRLRGIESLYRGPALYGTDYVKAIQYSKISLGILNDRNRDEHSNRTFEIPYIGSALCAQRTSDHKAIYSEDVEAVFWDNAEECADKCLGLLNDEPLRQKIARAGHDKVVSIGQSNDDMLRRVMNHVDKTKTIGPN